jgi:hypothetical protein
VTTTLTVGTEIVSSDELTPDECAFFSGRYQQERLVRWRRKWCRITAQKRYIHSATGEERIMFALQPARETN